MDRGKEDVWLASSRGIDRLGLPPNGGTFVGFWDMEGMGKCLGLQSWECLRFFWRVYVFFGLWYGEREVTCTKKGKAFCDCWECVASVMWSVFCSMGVVLLYILRYLYILG